MTQKERTIYEIMEDVEKLDKELSKELFKAIHLYAEKVYKKGFINGQEYVSPWNN